jgi:hypothetical protein
MLYLLIGLCGLNCCALCVLGNGVAKKQGIEMGLCKSGVCAFFNSCKCVYLIAVTLCLTWLIGCCVTLFTKSGRRNDPKIELCICYIIVISFSFLCVLHSLLFC